MTPSYALRIESAKACLREAEKKRDAEYPGTPRWERLNGNVEDWQHRVSELEAEASLLREP